MTDIRISPVSGTSGRHVVHGPHEPDYGRLHYGWIERTGDGFEARGCDSRVEGGARALGTHPTLKSAGTALAHWAERNLTAQALSEEFEDMTAGGQRIAFLRRAGGAIVATVTRTGGDRMTTSWDEDGTCSLYAHSPRGSGDHLVGESLRLVRREPAPEPDVEPAPSGP